MKAKFILGFTLVASLALSFSQEHLYLDPNLKLFPRERPGLIGYLGDPTTGHPSEDVNLSWLPSGLILTQGLRPYGSLRMWSDEAGEVRFIGTTNASGRWAVSPDGSLMCSQAPKLEDNPTAAKGMRLEPQGLVCHRFSDKKRLWEWDPGTMTIRDLTFSPDGKELAVRVHDSARLIVCLLDASTGQEQNRITLPGVHTQAENGPGTLAYEQDAIWVMGGMEKNNGLFRITRTDLQPRRVPLDFFRPSASHSMLFSPDENWLVINEGNSYQVYQRDGISWKPAFAGDSDSAEYGDYQNITATLFSPDNRFFFVSTLQSAKVISLSQRALLKSFSTGCSQAAFSPQGDVLLLAHETGFTRLDTRTWIPNPPSTAPLHKSPIASLHFLDDGKRLLGHDRNALVIWDMASRKASAVLQSDREVPYYSVPALVNQGRELISSDGTNFIRWILPPATPVSGGPQACKGTQAFSGPPSDESAEMKIFADESGQRVITAKDERWTLRDSHEKSRIVDLGSFGRPEMFPVDWVKFLSEDRAASFSMAGMAHVDLKTGTVLQTFDRNPSPWGDKFLNLPSDRKLCAGSNSYQIRIFDPETGQVIKEIKASAYSNGFKSRALGPIAAFSKDGFLMAAIVSYEQFEFLCFWDVHNATLLGGFELGDDEMTCLEFSPDNKVLAAGHHHRAISLWDVQKVLDTLRPESEFIPKIPPTPLTKVPYVLAEDFPQESLQGQHDLKWTFRRDGSIRVGESLPSFGELWVGGEVVELKSRRFWNRTDGQLGSSFTAMVEGESKDRQFAVSRLHQGLTCLYNGYDSTDGLTNLSAETRKVTLEFRLKLPSGCQTLQTETKRTIDLRKDGVLHLAKDECWVAASDALPLGQAFPAFRVRSWSAQSSPELHWEKSSQLLKIKYQVDLKPFETRWVNHCLAFIKRPEGGSAEDFEFPNSADFCHAIGWGEAHRGINFSRIHNDLPAAAHGFLSVWSENMRFELAEDSFGFTWDVTYGGGRSGELGAEQLFSPWLDERPLGFGMRSLLRGPKIVNAIPLASKRSSFRSLDGTLGLYRMDFSRAGYPITIWQDTLKNNTDEEKEFRLSFVHSFSSPVTEIVDNHGKIYSIDKLDKLNASEAQGCAFVIAGDARPATLITLNRQGSKIRSSLRRLSGGVFAQDYRITIGSSASLALIHAACQRPLSAFASAEEAFADLLPLRRPEQMQGIEKFDAVSESIPILNSPFIEP